MTRWLIAGGILLVGAESAAALQVVYPPVNHQTTAPQIFLIGTHRPTEPVRVNGQVVLRSPAGHFAPSIPLALGDNPVQIQAGTQNLTLNIRRTLPPGQATPLIPAVDVAYLPGEPLCFEAMIPPTDGVKISLGTWQFELFPSLATPLLGNDAVLINSGKDIIPANNTKYRGCLRVGAPGLLGQPELLWGTQRWRSPGTVTILDPNRLPVATLTSEGIARTGPSTDYSRLTPLPAGTQDQVIAQVGDWVQLRYGGWVQLRQVTRQVTTYPPQSILRGVQSRIGQDWTEIHFPLTTAIPIEIHQEPGVVHLTLWHTTAQTDTIRLDNGAAVRTFTWQQRTPQQVRYSFYLKGDQAWGYRVHYQDNVLILALRHPPQVPANSLRGIKILLDPGHGGNADLGALGPDGTPEKQVNLPVSLGVAERLRHRGAEVIVTRTTDVDVGLAARVAQIQTQQPHLALSIHYNALPDAGNAWETQGIGTFWYHQQSHNLAVFLQHYLTQKAQRPSYGIFWNNLALTRPTVCPAVLLELGFMIHPQEFEWIIDPQAQIKLAQTLADGIESWLRQAVGTK
ncbi:cell wall hydrolase/autolysin [Gloeomargarita lithophora Alchichica-D10]|uniref:Cell wall hydrolase/autolysin n=1 Tax=Gloeomargarita lithophora Alchichica-D10 TaxID=1188229 RepID=A0A1J0AD40_9CYAN|nr:N-acetylmuramoyl-L-alanine amidase [Gloeomargarita lithophora]APB33850.1 cell wall hydrolase/autolysin [Gloeomargarita lithophora Alchichica-D10]